MRPALTFGVEEEFLVVDRTTGALVPRRPLLLPAAEDEIGAAVEDELNLCQVEVTSPVCTTLDELDGHVRRLRQDLSTAAASVGLAIAATATHPFSSWREQRVTPSERYLELEETYQHLAREQVICGCHIHVGMDDPDLAVAVMTRVRRWLPILLALSANSPYWEGRDTGYASYRTQVWSRWPTAGMPPALRNRAAYDGVVDTLVQIGALPDPTYLYWHVRPSDRYPTLELRICDVCLRPEHTVALAGLARALVSTCADQEHGGVPDEAVSRDVLDAATWHAARYGLRDQLVSPTRLRLAAAADVVDEVLEFAQPGLLRHGDGQRVAGVLRDLVVGGTGADQQREAHAEDGDPLAAILRATAGDGDAPIGTDTDTDTSSPLSA